MRTGTHGLPLKFEMPKTAVKARGTRTKRRHEASLHSMLTCCPYAILGVDPTSSKDEINKAWKKLMLQYHPDKNPLGDGISRLINEAREAALQGKHAQPPYFSFTESARSDDRHPRKPPTPPQDYSKTHPGRTHKVALWHDKTVYEFVNAWMNDHGRNEQTSAWIFEKYRAFAVKKGKIPYKTSSMLTRRLAEINGVKEHRMSLKRLWRLDHLDAIKDYIEDFVGVDPNRTLKDL
jgi:hypothetical protein